MKKTELEVPIVRLVADELKPLPDRFKAVLCMMDGDGVYQEVEYATFVSVVRALKELFEDWEALRDAWTKDAFEETQKLHDMVDSALRAAANR